MRALVPTQVKAEREEKSPTKGGSIAPITIARSCGGASAYAE